MKTMPVCPECGRSVIEFTFTGGETQWYHLIDGMPQPSSPACARPEEEKPVKKAQQSEEERYAAIHDVLMPEANYHYNAMQSMQGLKQEGLANEDAIVLIQASLAWSQMGLLRSKIREGSK